MQSCKDDGTDAWQLLIDCVGNPRVFPTDGPSQHSQEPPRLGHLYQCLWGRTSAKFAHSLPAMMWFFNFCRAQTTPPISPSRITASISSSHKWSGKVSRSAFVCSDPIVEESCLAVVSSAYARATPSSSVSASATCTRSSNQRISPSFYSAPARLFVNMWRDTINVRLACKPRSKCHRTSRPIPG